MKPKDLQVFRNQFYSQQQIAVEHQEIGHHSPSGQEQEERISKAF